MYTDFHDIHSPGMPGDIIRYEIQRTASGWFFCRADAQPGSPYTGPFARYDHVLDALQAIEAAGMPGEDEGMTDGRGQL